VLTAQVAGGDIVRFVDDMTVADVSTDSLVQTNAKPDAGGATTAALVSAVRETLDCRRASTPARHRRRHHRLGRQVGLRLPGPHGRLLRFPDGASNYAVNSDAYGHGTHVAGLVGARARARTVSTRASRRVSG